MTEPPANNVIDLRTHRAFVEVMQGADEATHELRLSAETGLKLLKTVDLMAVSAKRRSIVMKRIVQFKLIVALTEPAAQVALKRRVEELGRDLTEQEVFQFLREIAPEAFQIHTALRVRRPPHSLSPSAHENSRGPEIWLLATLADVVVSRPSAWRQRSSAPRRQKQNDVRTLVGRSREKRTGLDQLHRLCGAVFA